MNPPRFRTVCALLLAAAVLSLTATSAKAQSQLRWKFQEGETLNYELNQDVSTSMNVMGQNLQTKMNQLMNTSMKIGKVDSDGKAQVTQKVTRIQFKMTLPPPLNQTIEYDSDSGEAPGGPFGKILGDSMGALVGAETSMTIDAKGKVSDFKVPQELVEKLKKSGGFGNLGAGGVSEDNIKQMTSYGFLSFPEKTLSEGDSWDDKGETKMPFGTMKMATKYTYAGRNKDGLDRIQSKIDMEIEPGDNAQLQLKLKEGESTGELLFDNKTGRLRQNKINQKMSMEITAGGQVIDQEITSLTTMKLVTGETKSRSQ